MKKIIIILLTLLFITGYSQTVSPQTVIKNVSAAEFKKLVDSKKGVLIDLRTDDELKNKGMIVGASQINFLAKDAEEQINKLDKNKTYYIYCAGGGRSGDCADLMQKSGFKEVINLEKGFEDWKKNGFEIEKK